ncbi:MAG: SdpI family protein [Bacteroidota bacterium]|nr:SdpI family protein [Bacteroidota bacterium]
MSKTKTILLQALISLFPTIYFLSIWKSLPESVPTHYDSNFVANDFGSKFEMLAIILFMFAVSLGTSLLVINLNKIDPKQRYKTNNPIIIKISWAVIIFMTLISGFLVYETEHYTQTNISGFSPKYIVALVALLFVVLGNFMNNIKPNYFVGIRTPWTLESEENWRMTHHLSSKIWFFGGLFMFLLVIFLPQEYALYVIPFSVVPLAGIPIFYSYYIFRQKQKNG